VRAGSPTIDLFAQDNLGLRVFVVTNQSGVARGYFTEETLAEVHRRLRDGLSRGGASVDAIYHRPHLPAITGECDCRKPRPGMIQRALREHDIDARRSCVVGDSWIDIEAGAAAGMPGLLVLTGYGRGLLEFQKNRFTTEPVHVADDLLDAARWILEHDRTPQDRRGGEER